MGKCRKNRIAHSEAHILSSYFQQLFNDASYNNVMPLGRFEDALSERLAHFSKSYLTTPS